MVNLKCGCSVNEEGEFILGDRCNAGGCRECKMMSEIHPFGNKRLGDFI